MSRREGDLTVKMKLHSLKIKDELQGRLSTGPQYLACSVQGSDEIFSSSGSVGPHGKEMSAAPHEDDDTFTDALPEFISSSDAGMYSQFSDITAFGKIGNVRDSTGFESAEALLHENDLVNGRGISSEIFYEAEGSNYSDFVSVIFSTRSPSSHDYDGIDTQVPTHLSLALN